MQPSFLRLSGVIALGFTLLVLLMVLAGSSSAGDKKLENSAAPVNVKRIAIESRYSVAKEVIGRIESRTTTRLGFDRGGLIQQMLVEEGDKVEAGQVLAYLQSDRLDAQIREADSGLKKALADAKLAELTKKRIASVVEKNLESSQRLDEAEARLDVALAAVEQAQASLSALDVEKQKLALIAPFSGTLIAQHRERGAVVALSEPIFLLQEDGLQEIRVSLPLKLAQGLSVGDLLNIKDYGYQAQLDRFISQQNLVTRTQDAIFTVAETTWQPLDGEIVKLEITVQNEQQGMWLPISALSTGLRGMWTIFIVNDQSKVESRVVTIISTNGENAYVTGAFNDGEHVVVDGTHRLVSGQQVIVVER